MNYTEYYIKCRKNSSFPDKPTLKEFYTNPVGKIPDSKLTSEYFSIIKEVSLLIKSEFDSIAQDDIMLKCKDVWKYRYYLDKIANYLVPYLESSIYGCHLYVDKIYIYRTLPLKERQSSYLWHYDNNPSEIVKNIIYLNEVTEKNSPFEYLAYPNDKGVIMKPTRTGPTNWRTAKNNSRITAQELEQYLSDGCKARKLMGKQGTIYRFNNNVIHRANPIISGYRDVINIRVKPTIKKLKNYISTEYTSGFEKSGAVNPYPDRL